LSTSTIGLHCLNTPIIAEKTGVLGLALMAFGATSGVESGIASGEKFDHGRLTRPRKQGGKFAKSPRVYIPDLGLFLNRDEAKNLLSLRGMHHYGCRDTQCCSRGIDSMIEDSRRHFAFTRMGQVAHLSRITPSLRPMGYHEEQCTVELSCSGDDDAAEPAPGTPLATGLYVSLGGKKYLVTNWHVAAGRYPDTEKQSGSFIPHVLFARETIFNRGKHVIHRFALYNDNVPQWIEAQTKIKVEGAEQRIDLAILPMDDRVTAAIGINLDDPQKPLYVPRPLDQICVIGFPFWREDPIWKTGHIAERIRPDCPYFLINARSKRGMSGSGVFSTSIRTHDNNTHVTNNLLLGIYSGRHADQGERPPLRVVAPPPPVGGIERTGADRQVPPQRSRGLQRGGR
jgi:hypothetical protein